MIARRMVLPCAARTFYCAEHQSLVYKCNASLDNCIDCGSTAIILPDTYRYLSGEGYFGIDCKAAEIP
jgi:hypothetical protein